MGVRRALYLLLMLTVWLQLHANGDPIVHLSSINRVANPEPLTLSDVIIIEENLNITHVDGYNCFDVVYRLQNISDVDYPTISYGFPIDYNTYSNGEYGLEDDYYTMACYVRGWIDDMIKDVDFSFNGQSLEWQPAKETVRESGYDIVCYDEWSDTVPTHGIDRRWYYTEISMPAHSTGILSVKYKVLAPMFVGILSGCDYSYYLRSFDTQSAEDNSYLYPEVVPHIARYLYDNFTILYDFSPAKHFGRNNEYKLNLNIDLSGINNPVVRESNYAINEYNVVERFNPAEAKPLFLNVSFTPDYSTENIERIIAPFIISENEYKLKSKPDTVSVQFSTPRYVTELAVDVDTACVRHIKAEITYADNTVVKRLYFRCRDYATVKLPALTDSPILLCITDSYKDVRLFTDIGFSYLDEDSNLVTLKIAAPEIKKIDLFIEYNNGCEKKGISNLRVLDSRFVKM